MNIVSQFYEEVIIFNNTKLSNFTADICLKNKFKIEPFTSRWFKCVCVQAQTGPVYIFTFTLIAYGRHPYPERLTYVLQSLYQWIHFDTDWPGPEFRKPSV